MIRRRPKPGMRVVVSGCGVRIHRQHTNGTYLSRYLYSVLCPATPRYQELEPVHQIWRCEGF